jgi:nitrite reductase (NO-forming)
VDKEYVLVQSEFYVTNDKDGLYHTDSNKMNAVQPDYVVFNGYANQYKDAPFPN